MSAEFRETRSIWTPQAPPRPAETLRQDLATDVCVVGAGLSGLTVAYLLACEGRRVVVLDMLGPGAGETGRTTAHLANAIDDRIFNLRRWRGDDVARLAVESHLAAIDRIESIVREEGIDCDFRRLDGYLFPAEGHGRESLDEELAAAQAVGMHDATIVARPFPGLAWLEVALRFRAQGRFEPLRYLWALHGALVRRGGIVYSGARAVDLQDGDTVAIETAHGPVVRAGAAVIATNVPFTRFSFHTKMAAYRTYASAFELASGVVSDALLWDTADPYHYVRLARDDGSGGALLIVGGEDHRTGQQEDEGSAAFAALDAWTRQRFPIGAARQRWSGQVMETLDGLGYIGPLPGSGSRTFVATGDSGMGMTHGTIAGMLLTDLIQGRENPWAEIYDPGRKPLAAAGTFARENFNVARQYLDWARAPAGDPLEDLPRGSGALFRHGGRRAAIFRDADGTLHACSAVCPHLRCLVSWNPTEHTWDCPCHGSRFDRYGKLLHGPATSDLEPLPAAADEAARH